MDKSAVLTEIKEFLEGYNQDLKYLVNVETDPRNNIAECIIHEPGKKPEQIRVKYTPFIYMKDLSQLGLKLYRHRPELFEPKKIQHGITITKLKTGNHKRLKNGYCFKITSTKSFNAIIDFLKDGKIHPYEKEYDDDGNVKKNNRGEPIYLYRDMFHSVRTTEQFLISTQSRLYKGVEEYKNIHKVTFDIETTGLRYQLARVFAIGVRDNRGFETILEVDKVDDDDSERNLIQDFFILIDYLRPAVISGYHSEEFDFDFILGRAKQLDMDLDKIQTGIKKEIGIKRRGNVSVKYGNTSDKYTATEMWGYSIIDIIHAVKRTAAVNSEIKEYKLKYIAKYEKFARENRTYIPGDDGAIGRYYREDKIFVINDKNQYEIIPYDYQIVARSLYNLQLDRENIGEAEYKRLKTNLLNENKEFVTWFREVAMPKNMLSFIGGKDLVKQYLLDDLWETEQVDELYNQSSFMLAKIVPTTYQRVCTMGTASIWNLLLTAWSYENDVAIPYSEKKEGFSGGLARCFKVGYSTKIIKIDYASLYPMLQLTWDIFPMFDITGVIKKMLLYLTTTRNIYKKLANKDDLNTEEISLLKDIDHDAYNKFIKNELTDVDRAMFKIKQLPIKILNNSLFGALGSGISFNWSDNLCAARITCNGRLELRHAINWFEKYGCLALMAVTDGINFQIPDMTTIRVTNEGVTEGATEGVIDEMWQYGGKTGISALIMKFNTEEMREPFMSVDNDGEYISCFNLARINYATLSLVKDKKNKEMVEKVKLTGNNIKSKIMPIYVEEFIDKGFEYILHGKGEEFVNYYYDYAIDIYQHQIPLRKIATRTRIKTTLAAYKKRGNDKNGKEKAKQAHMEMLIAKRKAIADKLFDKHEAKFEYNREKGRPNDDLILKLVANYMPPEPELDSVVFQVNTGYLASHGNSQYIKDKDDKTIERYSSELISAEELLENPEMKGNYNVPKYLSNFNKRVKTLLVAFDPEIQKKIPIKIVKKKVKDEFGNRKVEEIFERKDFNPGELDLKNFDRDTLEEAMCLEDKEIEFWNKTGYDPRLVWDGFNNNVANPVYYEIYESALAHLNDLMEKSGKPKIKSVNDKLETGEFVLLKDDSIYQLGKFNGIYIEIVRENIENIPKTEIEIEIDRKNAELEGRIKKLEVASGDETEKEKELKAIVVKRKKYFGEFKEMFGLPETLTMEDFFEMEDSAAEALDEYVSDQEFNGEDSEADEES